MNGLASTKLVRKPHCDSVYRLPDRVNSAFFNASISSLRAFALHQTAVLKPETWSRQSDQSRFWAMSTISDMFASLSHVFKHEKNIKKIKCQQIPNNHSATECFVSCKVVQEAKQQHNIKPLTAACGQNHHLKDSKTNENTWFHAYGGITNSYVWSQSSDFQIPRRVSLPCVTTPTDMPRVKFLPVRLWKELYCIRLEGALVKCFNLSAAFCRTSNWASRKSQPQLGCRVNQE